MKIEITNEQLLEAIKPITRATTKDYANTIKAGVYAYAAVVAYIYAIGLHLRDIAKAPKIYLTTYSQVAKRQQLEAVAAPAKPPVKPPVKTVSRKRSARNVKRTTPAVTAA